MSIAIARDTLNLRGADRLGHIEYCDHFDLVKAVTGLDPQTQGDAAWRAFYDAWNYDFRWVDNDGPLPWKQRGRVTNMGHAEFLRNGIDKWDPEPSPFRSVEEVWAFDAAQEYGCQDLGELTRFYENLHQAGSAAFPNQISTGGYYRTLVSGAIDAFGWEMLLAAAADQQRFDRVLEGIFQLSLHHYKAWARTSVEVFICHDDMVWTEGAFMHPDFYRRAIFPRYAKLWQVLHEAGIKVLFCSDGNWTRFVDDIAAAGADGFIFEPITDLDYVAARYGKTHIILGSKVDCRTMTFGTTEQIRREIDDTLKLARNCRAFVFAVGNHLPSNIPIDNALYYYDYLSRNWSP